MKFIFALSLMTIFVSGCATRRKVFEVPSATHWSAVADPQEFMTPEELQFLGLPILQKTESKH